MFKTIEFLLFHCLWAENEVFRGFWVAQTGQIVAQMNHIVAQTGQIVTQSGPIVATKLHE